MHCGVLVTGYNQGDWERLMEGNYDRPPTTSDAENMDDTLYMGDLVEPLGFDSIWATEHYGSAFQCNLTLYSTSPIGPVGQVEWIWVPL